MVYRNKIQNIFYYIRACLSIPITNKLVWNMETYIKELKTKHFWAMHVNQKWGLFPLIETFRFWDENIDDHGILSILSIALAWTSIILAGRRDSRRHSTTSFNENVIVVGTSYQMLEIFIIILHSRGGLQYQYSFPGVFLLRTCTKTLS